ncbi:MAG: polyprenyl synthetase family protein, partial [Pseudomonadota bacterium]
PPAEQAALRSYGKSLGIAFQLVDDALDYSGESKKLGKAIGDDFREGKITLPVILAYRRGNAAERAFWQRTIGEADINDGDLEHAVELMVRHKTIDASLERARYYGSVARDAMATFPDSVVKKAMLDVVDFCIARAI